MLVTGRGRCWTTSSEYNYRIIKMWYFNFRLMVTAEFLRILVFEKLSLSEISSDIMRQTPLMTIAVTENHLIILISNISVIEKSN